MNSHNADSLQHEITQRTHLTQKKREQVKALPDFGLSNRKFAR